MRKSLLFFFTLLLVISGAVAQRPCYSAAYSAELLHSFPGITRQRAAIENFTRDIILKRKLNGSSTPEVPAHTSLVIPVVVHILYNTCLLYTSDAADE